jgi:hypothetical protein
VAEGGGEGVGVSVAAGVGVSVASGDGVSVGALAVNSASTVWATAASSVLGSSVGVPDGPHASAIRTSTAATSKVFLGIALLAGGIV